MDETERHEYTSKGNNCDIEILVSFLTFGQLLKERICFLWKQILSLKQILSFKSSSQF